MPYTTSERELIQTRMFGCTCAQIDASITPGNNPLSMAMSILSDAQEMLAHDPDDDRIRQTINRAKYLIDKANRPEPMRGLEAQVVSVNGYPPNVSGYDYTNQAWVENGRYVSCVHPSAQCGCYGKIHEDEPIAANANIH